MHIILVWVNHEYNSSTIFFKFLRFWIPNKFLLIYQVQLGHCTSTACSRLCVLCQNIQTGIEEEVGKNINIVSYLWSIHFCRLSNDCQILRSMPYSLLHSRSIVFMSSLLWRMGHSWPERKLMQLLLLAGQSSSCNATKTISQKTLSAVWELVTVTLELRWFYV